MTGSPPPTTPTHPLSALCNVGAAFRSRHLTGASSSLPLSKETSPLLFQPLPNPCTVKQAGAKVYDERDGGVSSKGESSSSSASTSSLLDERGRGERGRGLSEPHYPSLATKVALRSEWRGTGRASMHHEWDRCGRCPPKSRGAYSGGRASGRLDDSSSSKPRAPPPSVDQTVMLNSLHSINSQLGELLSRVGGAKTHPHPTFLEEPVVPSSNAR